MAISSKPELSGPSYQITWKTFTNSLLLCLSFVSFKTIMCNLWFLRKLLSSMYISYRLTVSGRKIILDVHKPFSFKFSKNWKKWLNSCLGVFTFKVFSSYSSFFFSYGFVSGRGAIVKCTSENSNRFGV